MTNYNQLPDLNTPKYNNSLTNGNPISDPTRFYNFSTFCLDSDNSQNTGDLSGYLDRQIAFIPYSVTARPMTLLLSDPDNTTVEISVDSQQNIVANEGSPPAGTPADLWVPQTSAAVMQFLSTITAIRITNTGTGAIQVRLAV